MTVTLESLKKSVGRKSAKSEIFAWLADLERAAGNLDGALQRVDNGLALYPNDVAAMIVRAKILFQQEKYEECVQQCETILVKDTFSLAGQKIMGDAYDKLGNIPERNLCYRRYHDMDPLNTFWKDEYDVVETAAVAAAVAADMTMSDADFSMPEEEGGLFTSSEQESGNFLGGDDSTFEKSFEDTFGSESSEESSEDDGGLFEKSSSSVGLSLDDDQSAESASPFSKGFDEPEEEESLEAPLSGGFGGSLNDSLGGVFDTPAQEESTDDDPFAALAAMLPNSDAAEDSMMEDLTASLDQTMATISAEDTADKPLEEFPADDNISGNDVNSAMASFFGLDDDLEAEETSTAGSSALDETPVDESASANASMVFGSSSEDQPMSVDNAFSSIFGDDELPEEKPQSAPVAEDSSELPAVESLDVPAEERLDVPAEESLDVPAEDKPLSVDNAFDSIFGEDELPEEKPVEAAAESLELPAEESLELPAEEPALGDWSPAPAAAEEPALEVVEETPALEVAEEKPADDGALSVDGAFSSIFGDDDDLPEEKPAEEPALGDWSPAPAAAEEPALEVVEESPAPEVAEEKPADDGALSVDGAFSSIFGDDDDLPEEKPVEAAPAEESLELPAEEPALGDWSPAPAAAEEPALEVVEESPAPEVAEEKPADDGALSVDGAFNSIFGDDDDLPEEKPVEAAPAEESLELPAEEPSMVEEVETPTAPAITSAMDFVLDDEPAAPAEEPAPASEASFTVDSAFSSIFGDDDDLPEEKPAEPVVETAPEETATLAEQVDQAEAELELPSVQKEDASDLAQEMGGAFASMFGDQDDLDLPALDGEDKLTFGAEDDQQATGAAFEEASESKLESDLDKSFSNLFGDDDDLSMPSENGAEAPAVESAQDTPAMQNLDSLESEVSGAFKGLFEMDDDSLTLDQDKPSNSGVDFLMSGDSDDEVSAGLINNPDAPLNRGAQEIDESLNTKTLAEIYFDQGLYGKALDIYKDLAQKEPENQEIANRMAEVEKLYKEKFGGNG
ncbi:hypothetical protein [Fibrobacter sp. UWEL]|uniref:hypothetical protein n=1 Tax=Fibrobacter sp. UWEL TaxID=1896209 RepID=UPI000920302F|nr:hypothetical protein [Fibrobacter sp. UWEL]SHL32879.1 hypothetical protein SAMN05720468_12227 [Fibrobacter sp. UWEL]